METAFTVRSARAAALALAFALALAGPARAEVNVISSLAKTSIQVMSGNFLLEFAAPVEQQQNPVTEFASSQSATPQGPHPATARASQTARVESTAGGLTVSVDGAAFARVPGVPDPPLNNLFAQSTAFFSVSFTVTERTTVAANAQALGSEADNAALIACVSDGGVNVERQGTSVSGVAVLEPGGTCNVTAFAIVTRNGNRNDRFLANPGEREARIRVSVTTSELGPDEGTVFRWVGPAQGAFDEEGNWQNENGGDGVPSFRSFEDADTAIVEGSSLDLDLGGAGLSRALDVRGVGTTRRTGRLAVSSSQTLRPFGGTLILDSLEPGIGNRSLQLSGARLLLDQGGVTARHVVVGRGNDADLEVVGPDGFFETAGRFGIGGDADGNVIIRGGAQVTSAETVLGEDEGSGFALVQDSGTLWQTENLAVGFADDAGLTIEGGARVESENAFVDCQVAPGADVPGCTGLDGDERAEATVRGAGTTWDVANALEVGTRGKVVVEGGGRLEAPFVRIGQPGGQPACDLGVGSACLEPLHGTVEVADGTLAAEAIGVGFAGDGELRIGPAGRVSSLLFTFVGAALTDGQLTVVGPSNEDQLTSPLNVGVDLGGRGELLLQAGARVAAVGANVGGEPGSEGLIELQGDAGAPDATVLRVTAPLEVGPSGDAEDVFGPTGEVLFANARIALEGTELNVNPLGRLSGVGRVDGTGIDSVVHNDGVVGCRVAIQNAGYIQGPNGVVECAQASPPASPQLNPFAASRFARAVRRARLEPPPPPPPGPFVVTGDATLDGTLVLQFLNGFAPLQGESVDLIDVAGNVTGAFANVSVRGLAPGADFAQDFVGGKLTVTSLTDAESLPVVSVKGKPAIREGKPKKGLKLKVSRKGDTSEALAVRYVLRGTASNGFDFDQLPGVIEIPARKKSAKLVLRAFGDGVTEGVETLELELLPGDNYTTSLFSKVETAISDEKPRKRR